MLHRRRAHVAVILCAAALAVTALGATTLRAAAPGGDVVVAAAAPSFQLRVAELYLRLQGKPFADEAAFRRDVLRRPAPVPPPVSASLRRTCDVVETRVSGHRVVRIAPKQGGTDLHIVYLHGGAYVDELSAAHWDIVQELVEHTGASVTVPFYPLAPRADVQDALRFLDVVVRDALMASLARRVVLAGDSAGGGLALVMAMRARDLKWPTPARVVLFAPWLDVTFADPRAKELEPDDVMLAVDAPRWAGAQWAGDLDPLDPRVSPLYGDPRGLPPIDVFQGTADILVVDVRTFARRAADVGAKLHLYEYTGAFHVFVGATFAPESQDAFARMAAALAPAGDVAPARAP